jgi:hypothetical protein
MQTSRKLTHSLMALLALLVLASAAFAQSIGPGTVVPATSEVSDQKAGSVLIYNIYTSSATSPNATNTRINITNTNPLKSATVHLFFVDGSNCSPADSYICLTQNQTASFLASDVDPGITGYLVAVAVDSDGCPVSFNWLIGDEYVKFASGHAANLGAEAAAALVSEGTKTDACDIAGGAAVLAFSGSGNNYNQMPRVLAVDNISSPVEGNNQLLIVNRIAGNLATGASTVGTLFGILFDDAENPLSFTMGGNVCQFRVNLVQGSFRVLGGGIEGAIPAGRTGWMKFYSPSDQAYLGSIINANPSTGSAAGAFVGGRNLHKLSLSTTASYTIPVFPPAC